MRSHRRWTARAVSTAGALVFAVVGLATPVSAHAQFVESSPAHGSVVTHAPEGIELRFSEPVVPVLGGIILRSGDDEVGGEVNTSGSAVAFVPEAPIPNGTAVLEWRVTSADGHPISGTLVFHVGQATETPDGDTEAGSPAVTLANSLAYLGLLIGGGLALFSVFVHDGGRESEILRRWARVLLVIGTVGAVAGLAGRWAEAGWSISTLPPGSLPMLTALLPGVAVAVALGGNRAAVSVGVAAALASLVFTGHSRTVEPTWLVAGSDLIHIVAGSIWAGGLAGVAIVSRNRSGSPSGVVARFSGLAGWALLGVLASGSILAWRIHGSWAGLTETSHGRLVLAKLGVVAAVAVVGALNRYRVLPSIAAGKVGRLATTTAAEAVGLALVLVLTGVLVEQDPSGQGEPATSAVAGLVQASLGDLGLGIELEPGRAGVNLARFTIRGPDGGPGPVVEPPRIAVLGPSGERAAYDSELVGDAYEANIELPAGPWDIEVRARVGTLDEASQTMRFEDGRLMPGSGLLAAGAVMPRPTAGTAAVYMAVASADRDLLVAAGSPACGQVTLHESVINDDGTASMFHRPEMELSETETLILAPGGLHLMCEEASVGLEIGDTVPFWLMTSGGERLDLVVTVVDIVDIVDILE